MRRSKTTTIRIQESQAQMLSAIAEHDEVSLADVQRAAFAEFVELRAQQDPSFAQTRAEVIGQRLTEHVAQFADEMRTHLGPSSVDHLDLGKPAET
jgi:hypothetical protein